MTEASVQELSSVVPLGVAENLKNYLENFRKESKVNEENSESE